MPQKTFLFITNHENAPLITPALADSLAGIACRREKDIKYQAGATAPYFCIETIRSPFLGRKGSAGFRDIEAALKAFLTSQHSFFILDRLRYFNGGKKTDISRNGFNAITHVQEGMLHAADMLQTADPEQIVFTSTPHDIEAWLFFLCAHHMGKRIMVISASALPWRACLKEIVPDPLYGYQVVSRLPTAKQEAGHPLLSGEAADYISRKRGDYQVAEPDYMKQQKKPASKKTGKRSKLQKYADSLEKRRLAKQQVIQRHHISLLDRLISQWLNKRRLASIRRHLNRYASKTLPATPYVVLFLHYQPERTSVPEGGFYAQQVIAIEALRSSLPAGWHLVVKEHPSIFMLKNGNAFRHPEFYRVVANMPGVYLVDHLTPSFELIDRARAVATLTGTVGFETLCRNIPAIALGDAAYRHFPGVIDVSRNEQPLAALESAIENAQAELARPQALEAQAAQVELSSISDGTPVEILSSETMTLALEHAISALNGQETQPDNAPDHATLRSQAGN